MPNMNDFEFINSLKAKRFYNEEGFEFVLLIGQRNLSNIINTLKRDTEVFLSKPLDKAKLKGVLFQSEFV